MSSSKKLDVHAKLPDKMVTPIVSIREVGGMIASKHSLPPGHYELVIEYKYGAGKLQEPDGAVNAMAISFGGVGLRRAEKQSSMTIEVEGGENPPPQRKKKPTTRQVK
jgi:hypothetical protein